MRQLPLLIVLGLGGVLGRDAVGQPVAGDLDVHEQAFRWRQLSRVDERGRIPAGALQGALDARNANIAAEGSPAGMSSRSVISRASWTNRGPRNVGGRTRTLVIHPQNPEVLWAGAAGGGVWRSDDGGASWRALDDFLPDLAVGSLALNPSDPNEIYCGTGEGVFNIDALDGVGIFKSSDGGLTWTQLPATASWSSVNRIAVSPSDGNVILAATRFGGIQRSTDAGATWTNVRSAQGSFDLSFDPQDGSKAVAHVIDYDFGLSEWFHSALYSTDGGATWSTSTGLSRLNGFTDGRIELAYAPANPQIVYASVAAEGGKIWRSTDGGQSYVKMTGSDVNGVNWYANSLWVSPTDSNFLVTGGGAVYKSADGGVTLAQISAGYILTDEPHPDVHRIVADPGYDGTTNKRVYVGTDGGVFRTDDITTADMSTGWVSLNATYQTSQYYAGAGVVDSRLLIGGTQDNGTLRSPLESSNATIMYGGDGGFVAIDPSDDAYCYGEYVNLEIHRSTDHCISAFQTIAPPETNGANFIAPFVLDPNDSNRMLAGGASVWVSNDVRTAASPSWSAIRSPGSDKVSAIAVAPGNSNVVWIGQNDGTIYKTTNGLSPAPSWATVDDNGATNPLPDRYPTRIVIDPDDADTVYVAFGGFAGGNLQRTTDGGATWTDVTGSGAAALPSAPIRGVARHPRNASQLYVGTEVGVFETTDGGATWSTANQGPSSAPVDELVFLAGSDVLLAATHGRGLWTADVGLDGAAQSKCLAAKTGCISKAGLGLLKCEQSALTPGNTPDVNAGGCSDKALLKFDGGTEPAEGCFERLESKSPNDCITLDDTTAAEAAIQRCVVGVGSAIDPAPLDQTRCGAGKTKCTSKLLTALLKCQAIAQTPGKPSDPNSKACVDKARAKYTGGTAPQKGCFAKLESKAPNDCQFTDDATALEAVVEGCVGDFSSLLRP